MNGWMGKILRIDLHNGEIKERRLDPEIAKRYIGGRGLGIYYLNEEMDPKCDPLSPENLLVMGTGPLTGTGAPTGTRYMVMTKSLLTGAITCSNSGGLFPRELKRSGFDALFFTGKASEPVYLFINDGEVELRNAKHLWGQTTHETTDRLLKETAINKANYLCNEMGMDTITMGATIACAMELVDRGYLSEKEIGLSLKWGDAEALVELTRKTGYREGFGNQLFNGKGK